MSRFVWAGILAAVSAALGCRPSPPAAAPPAPPAAPAAQSNEPQASAAPKPAEPIATPTSNRADSTLRGLAARLIEIDAKGAWRTNDQAATELEKLGSAAIPQFRALLDDPDAAVRRGAARFLSQSFDPANAEDVAAFSGLLEDSDRIVRVIALSKVSDMLPAGKIAALPKLTALLDPRREASPDNRATSARHLSGMKSDAAAALPALAASATGDPEARVRSAALLAIAQVASAGEAAPALAKGLADTEASVRLVAAARLRSLGAGAAPAVKELAAALADADPRVRDAAAETLIVIGQPAAKALAEQLASANAEVKKLALAALYKIGPPAKEAAQAAIEKCTMDPDPEVRQLAEAAIKRIAPASK